MDSGKASCFENGENGHDALQKHRAILARSRWFRTMRARLSSLEGQGLKDVSEIMKFPGEKHEGVWFQGWIFHNLLVFSRSAP